MSQQSPSQTSMDLVARLQFSLATLGDISSLSTSEGKEGQVEQAALRATLGTVGPPVGRCWCTRRPPSRCTAWRTIACAAPPTALPPPPSD